MDMNRPTTRVRDLNAAAALASCGFAVQEIERDVGRQAYFVFIKTAELDRTISEYWANTLEVKARIYSDNIKMLKTRIYSE